MKPYHEMMRDFAMQRVSNENETMFRINIAILHGWGMGTKWSHVPAARRHYERCKARRHNAAMSAAYHGYVIAIERNLGR